MGTEVNETEYNEKIMKQARKRVALKKGLTIHAMCYVIVNVFLVAIYYLTTPGGYFWPVWPIIGWGVGLLIHAIVTMQALAGGQSSTMQEYERLLREQKK